MENRINSYTNMSLTITMRSNGIRGNDMMIHEVIEKTTSTHIRSLL